MLVSEVGRLRTQSGLPPFVLPEMSSTAGSADQADHSQQHPPQQQRHQGIEGDHSHHQSLPKAEEMLDASHEIAEHQHHHHQNHGQDNEMEHPEQPEQPDDVDEAEAAERQAAHDQIMSMSAQNVHDHDAGAMNMFKHQ